MSDFSDFQKRADDIKVLYDEFNQKRRGKLWDGKDFAMGFAGDFGDLMKLVMAKEGVRDIEDADAKFEHELADCLWSVLVLAKHYDVDLEQVFMRTMNELEARIKKA